MHQETIVNGTVCRIVFPHEDPNYVYKHPINRNTSARELYDRYSRTAERVMYFYMTHYAGCELVIPEMELVEPENCIRQVRVKGKMLGHMSNEEVSRLQQRSIGSLIALLSCAEEMPCANEDHDLLNNQDNNGNSGNGDFLDVFGYDYSYNGLERIRRATDVRYSTNIMIDDNGRINLIDPDFYYASCRNKFTRFFASLFKEKMFESIRKYKAILIEKPN